MTTETKVKPGSWGIAEVNGGGQWVVGRDNSDTELFYFDTQEAAIAKFIEICGPEFVIRAMTNHDQLLRAAKASYFRLLSLGLYAGRETAAGQAELALLRDVIAAATDRTDEDVQNDFESRVAVARSK